MPEPRAHRRRARRRSRSTLPRPSTVSICAITIVRACSAAIFRDDIAALRNRRARIRNAGAAAALRRIARARDDVRGLVRRADHRHHDAHRADVERAGDEVIFAARHAHHRHDRRAPAQRELRLQRLEAEAGVLHVEQDELSAGVLAELRQAGRKNSKTIAPMRASLAASVALTGLSRAWGSISAKVCAADCTAHLIPAGSNRDGVTPRTDLLHCRTRAAYRFARAPHARARSPASSASGVNTAGAGAKPLAVARSPRGNAAFDDDYPVGAAPGSGQDGARATD